MARVSFRCIGFFLASAASRALAEGDALLLLQLGAMRASKTASLHELRSAAGNVSSNGSYESSAPRSAILDRTEITSPAMVGQADVKPRMLVMDGCSGSSFITGFAMKLLQHLGMQVVYFGDAEMLKPQKNAFYTQQEGLGVAMEKANEHARSKGGLLVFQMMSGMLTKEEADPGLSWAGISPHLQAMDTHVVYAYRQNVLDYAVCKVRDCFSSGYGVPVNASGDQSTLCFDRRSNDGAESYKAKLIPGELVSAMRTTEESFALDQSILRTKFSGFNTLIMEDLLAFQYERGLTKSTTAWKEFMQSWGVQAEERVIYKFLKANKGLHDPPGLHSESIYNIGEVGRELKRAHMDQYLRE